MRLTAWSTYVPPAGARLRVHYRPDGHSAAPDIFALKRAIDARPGVAVRSVLPADGGVDADIVVLTSDSQLLSVLGTYVSDGSDRFWKIESVDRIDDRVPNRIELAVETLTDRLLDPIETASGAAVEAVQQTAQTVKRWGIPTALIVVAAVIGFLAARRL